MKSQIKRFSKSTISVMLAICMLVSCMTVGLIATDAAYDNGENVGSNEFNQKYLYVDMSSYSSYTLTGVNAYWNYECNDGDMWNTTKTNMGDNIYRFDLSSMNSSYLYFRGFKVVTSGNSNTIGVDNGQTDNMIKVSSTGTLSWTTFSAYYVASGENSFTGNSWDAADINGKMSASGTNYVKTFSNVNQKTYKYKVTKNGNWDNAYPADNIECVVPFNGASVTITKDNSNNVSHKIEYTHTASSATNGRVYVGTTTGTSVTTDYANDETTYTIYATPNSNYVVNTISVGGTVIYTNSSNATGTISQTRTYAGNETVSATFKVANTKLDKPTNVALTSSTVTATPNSTVRLSWTSVTNAGSYKVYLDGNLVETVTTAYYDIDKKASSAGDYTVVAVPSNIASYSESDPSSAVSLTVSKTSLPTPEVTISPLDIASGSSTTATFSNYSSLSSYISGGYATLTRGTRAYEASSGAFTTNTAVTSTSGSETLSPTSSIQYAYYMSVTATGSEYYYQSGNSAFYDVYVASASWYLIGDISGNWTDEKSDYKLTSYNGDNIFYYVYTATGSKYFSFSSGGTRYNPKGATYESPCDVTSIGSQEDAIELESNNTSSSFHISTAGTYVIYIDQSNNTVWVEQNTRLLNIYAYTQTFNLSTDSHNTPTESTTGGTVQPSGEQLINKNTSTTLVATAKSGYTFQGWYNNTDFAVAHRVSTNASYTFTVTSDGNYYALFKQNTPAHYTLSVASVDNATVTATYNGTTLQEGSGTKSVPVGATVNYSISLSNGYKLDSSTPSGLTVGSGSFTMPASNTAVTISVSKITYNLTSRVTINNSTVTTSYGNLKFYENSTCTTQITTAQIGDTFYAKYTPPTTNSAYYTSGAFSVYSGTGLTGPTNQATNIKKFVMGYSDAIIAVNVVATTPSLTCAAMSGEVYANESFTYNGATVSPAIKSGFLSVSYQFQGTTNTTGTFTAPSTAGTYTMTVKASNKPTDINTAATASRTVDIVVKYRQQAVSYYVDMHNNNMTGKTIQIAIVKGMGDHTILIDNDGNPCSKTLSKQGSSAVYFASINTPTTKSGSNYNDVNIMVTYNGNSYVYNLPGGTDEDGKVDDLVRTKEMWLEAENEASTQLTVNYSTRSTSTVPEGSRRIYLAKPYGWQNDEPSWENIGIYHWGDYTDIGWNAGIKMHYLGNSGSDGYHYYYADIPKAINGNKVSNIIFQGWGSNQSAGTYSKAQTGNIENIPDSANFYILSKDGNAFVGTKSEEDAVIANYTRYVSSVEMNKTESTEVNISPTYTGGLVTYTPKVVGTPGQSNYINHGDYVTVDRNGVIHPVKSTIGLPDDCAEIIVKVYSTIGRTIYEGSGTDAGDCLTYTVRVNIHDPSQFNGFEIMSLESQTYTVSVPQIGSDQPGYFDMTSKGSVITVTGLLGVDSSTKSAIINPTTDNPTSFTVKYAKANNTFSGYSDIEIIGTIVTKSNHNTTTGKRYGLKQWKLSDDPDPNYTISRKVANGTGIETATTTGVTFSSASATYSAIFEEYQYVDVTFTFNYDEYVPKVVDGMIQYPYDADWANNEDSSDASSDDSLYNRSHNTKTFVIKDYEVRYRPEKEETFEGNLKNAAAIALGIEPSNNYYDYKLPDTVSATTQSDYKATSTVKLIQSVKQYKVFVNGVQIKDSDNNPLTYTYQEYAEPSVQIASDWYAVDSSAQNASTDNAPLLATNVNSYKFRVKGSANSTNTYLRTVTATNPHGNDFLRSEVDFSHYEVTHQGSSPTSMKEYLMQNFYIADFFSPAEVLDPKSYTGKGKIGEAYKVEKSESSASPSSGNITVYFTDTLNWNNIKIYYWGENIDVQWPGNAMMQYGTDEDGKTVYSASISENVEGIIFTGNEKQTVDITKDIANGSHWKSINETAQNGIPYDDAQFVGGGVVYYSMNGVTENSQGTPFANAVSSGYVDGSTGEANPDEIKEMLKANIEAYYSEDVSGALGEEEAMKIAYGTEIAATKNVEGGFNTGIIYRYLPLTQYKRVGKGEQTVDIDLSVGSNIVKWKPKSKTGNKWEVSHTTDGSFHATGGQRTVRFQNTENWDVVCVHYWGGSKASYWPGIKMSLVEGQTDVYEAVIPADSTNVVFSDGGYMPETDGNGDYTLDNKTNNNTFRYSNSLQSYQYVYASGNENKATNAGKNMRLYSYYVYSYVTYDQETNVPVTKYEIVLSDNYSDASTYWEGNPNPDPSN